MTDDDGIKQLREQTDVGTRLNESTDKSDTKSDDVEDAIVSMLTAVDEGEVAKTLSLRDEQLAALIHGLEETGQLDDVGAALRDHLNREPSTNTDRSDVLRLAIRAGLQQAAPDVVETAREAYGRHASEQF